MHSSLYVKQRQGCVDASRDAVWEQTIHVLGYGGEDAEPGTELLDGSSGFEPAMPLLLLGLEELITEMFPLLWGECTQDPAMLQSQIGLSARENGGVHCYIVWLEDNNEVPRASMCN